MLPAETAHRTLGVDLASQAANTAGCIINWGEGTATVETIRLGLDDDAIAELTTGCEKVGIDAPFGWPEPFVAFIREHEAGTFNRTPWSAEWRDGLRFRRTGAVVREALGRWPLSVSSDLIAITAMRCAGLLATLDTRDRSGSGSVVEVYPAVALHQWGLSPRGYKGTGNVAVLAKLLAKLRKECPRLVLSAEQVSLCAQNDHAFDAVISALIARAAM
ncbi:MAG TPA: DUF429 domain-containing protein, partial [Thermomicrobiales bacterium]|nr:DUF429 domain-containing protein [Thermomicrobiales bacterium]